MGIQPLYKSFFLKARSRGLAIQRELLGTSLLVFVTFFTQSGFSLHHHIPNCGTLGLYNLALEFFSVSLPTSTIKGLLHGGRILGLT